MAIGDHESRRGIGPGARLLAIAIGKRDIIPGHASLQMGHAAPGIMAAALCGLNMILPGAICPESRDAEVHAATDDRTRVAPGGLTHLSNLASLVDDLDLCDLDWRVSEAFQCSLSKRPFR